MDGLARIALAAAILLGPTPSGARTFGTLVVVESEPVPPVTSPLSADRPAEWRLVELVYAPLYARTAAGTYEPHLAEKVTASADGTVLTVSLRPDARWSVGREVGPQDVVYTYELARTGRWNRAFVDLLRPVKEVRRSDDGLDVHLVLHRPVKQPEALLTVPLVPGGLHGPLEEPSRLRPMPASVVGAGPYRLASDGDTTRLQVNEHATTSPRIAEIRFTSAGSPSLALEYVRLLGNAVTFEVDPQDAPVVAAELSSFRLPDARERLWAIVFSPTDTMLGDPVVRRAVRLAIERSELAGPGESFRPAASPFPSVSSSSPLVSAVPKGDVVEAQAELWWSGWQREPDQPTFVRKLEAGETETVELSMLVDADDPRALRRAAILRRRLSEAGIALAVDPRPHFQLRSRVRSREFPAALVALELLRKDGADIPELFHSKGSRAVLPGEDPKLDALLDQGDIAGAVAALAASDRVIFLGIEDVPRGVAGRNVAAPVVMGLGGLSRIEKWRVR